MQEQTVKDFVDIVRHLESDTYIGIDPGTTGAIGLLNECQSAVVDIPTLKIESNRKSKIQEGKKRRKQTTTMNVFDYERICWIFNQLKRIQYRCVILEQVPSGMGLGFNHAENMLNRAYAMWPLFLYSHGFQLFEVPPLEWKLKMGLKRFRNEKQSDQKERSRQLALKLFPGADIQRKMDDNRAEALLIAYYGRSKYGQTNEVSQAKRSN